MQESSVRHRDLTQILKDLYVFIQCKFDFFLFKDGITKTNLNDCRPGEGGLARIQNLPFPE